MGHAAAVILPQELFWALLLFLSRQEELERVAKTMKWKERPRMGIPEVERGLQRSSGREKWEAWGKSWKSLLSRPSTLLAMNLEAASATCPSCVM